LIRRLELPDGRFAAVAAVQTFGDSADFHPHLHVLSASFSMDPILSLWRSGRIPE
jgi:hypothetical protein